METTMVLSLRRSAALSLPYHTGIRPCEEGGGQKSAWSSAGTLQVGRQTHTGTFPEQHLTDPNSPPASWSCAPCEWT